MAIRTRIDSISRDIDVFVNEMLSPDAQSKAVADFTRGAIADADQANKQILGRLPSRTVTVDGRQGAALESVRPVGGVIVAEWDLVNDVLTWIGQTLWDRSPRVSGDYQNGHTLFADGVEVQRGQQVPPADTYTFINLVAYARKIELGKTKSGRDFVIKVPNRIYERTYKDAKSRFGNIAKITTGFEAATGAYRLKHDQAHRSFAGGGLRIRKKQSSDRVAGSAVTVPAIYVSLLNRK
jgi:hypothetical protein